MSGRALQKQNRYYKWWDKVEKRILILVIILFSVLYAVQLLNFVMEQRSSGPLASAVDELEGISVAESQTQINTGTIELSVVSKSDYSKIAIYINGEYYKSFNQKSVSLMVKNNDIIEINGIKSEYPASIKITSISNNVVSPKLDSTIKVNRSFVQAGRITLK